MADEPPDPDPHADALGRALAEGIEALRRGQHRQAATALAAVCDDRAFARAADLADVRARALSLCAEALLGAGQPQQAMARAQSALVLARRLGDTLGVQDIEQLQQRIARAAPGPRAGGGGAADASLLEVPADEVDRKLAGAPPELRADWLQRWAAAAASAGRTRDAAAALDRALHEATEVLRVQVLARIALAALRPADAGALLQRALDLARDADQHTLVGAVARAAAQAGVAIDGEAP
ncbi:MAG: hypothetical protein R3F59_35035 [Myxococcota bacterium]